MLKLCKRKCYSATVLILISWSCLCLYYITTPPATPARPAVFCEECGINVIHDQCNIPIINPFYNKALELIQEEENKHIPPVCRHHSNVKFHADSQSNLIRLQPDSNYWFAASCCYVGFDSHGKAGNDCAAITSDVTKIPDKYAFVNVKCGRKGLIDYQDQFQFFRLNSEIQLKQAQLAQKYSGQDQPSIIMFGLDSVSRANFVRSLPKSYQLIMQNLSGLEFSGRNTIGAATFENLLGTLTGTLDCSKAKLADCQLIWNRFAAKGYTTLKAEDETSLAVHFYPRLSKSYKTGQMDTHYDHLIYIRKMVELNIKKANHVVDYGCHDYQWTQRIVQERILNQAKAMVNAPYFQFSWLALATHEVVGYAKYLDDPIFNLLTSLHSGNFLNNTILILLSDHGNGNIKSVQGPIEQKMPLLFFVFPPWFLKKYSDAINNMRKNANRLTTAYDLHETLLDLLDLNSLTNPTVQNRSKNGIRLSSHKGVSLFLPVPRNRTCLSANIPDQFCICCSNKKTTPVSKADPNVKRVVQFAFEFIQKKLSLFPVCASLTLFDVEDAQIVQPCKFSNIAYETYLVQFRTLPNEAIFEAQVAIDDDGPDKLRLVGSINRLNRYGSQSECLELAVNTDIVRWIRSVCFCKKFLTPNNKTA